MSPDEALTEAKRRIQIAKESSAPQLDLGDLPMPTLPSELGDLRDLRLLTLGLVSVHPDGEEVPGTRDRDRPVQTFTNLEVLAGLSNLEVLSLAFWDGAADLSMLASLRSLRSLDLQRTQVSDLKPLASLTSLRQLKLAYCSDVEDLTPLSALTGLEHLDVGVTSISDLTPLTALTRLETLSIAATGARDLSPLSGMLNLQWLYIVYSRHVHCIEPLARLRDLRHLDLGVTSVSDLTPLTHLRTLNSLGMAHCEHVRDLSPLSNLAALKRLNLVGCAAPHFAPVIPLLPHLEALFLQGSSFEDLPAEVCGSRESENVLDKVRAHFADLTYGGADDAEVKLFLLGNGGVGKTQTFRRLTGLSYDETIPSTHGIQLGETTVNLEDVAAPVRLNMWDFGGQDVYHGTHALFLQRRAIFVLLWSPDFEAGDVPEAGVMIRHRPLAY